MGLSSRHGSEGVELIIGGSRGIGLPGQIKEGGSTETGHIHQTRGGTSASFTQHCRLTNDPAIDMKTSEGLSVSPCSQLGGHWPI